MFSLCLLVLSVVISVTSGSSNSPKYLCISDCSQERLIDYYKRSDSLGGFVWVDESSNTYIEYSTSNETWIIYDENKLYGYCEELPITYIPSFDNPGDPSDCKQWNFNKITITNDVSDCILEDNEMGIIEWLLVAYTATTIIILIIITNLSRIHHDASDETETEKPSCSCNSSYYDGSHLETYKTILTEIDPNARGSLKNDESIAVLLLKHDLLVGKVAWHGDYLKDFYHYIRNNHVFFALFYRHKLGPLTSVKLWSIMVGINLFAIVATILTTLVTEHIALDWSYQNLNSYTSYLLLTKLIFVSIRAVLISLTTALLTSIVRCTLPTTNNNSNNLTHIGHKISVLALVLFNIIMFVVCLILVFGLAIDGFIAKKFDNNISYQNFYMVSFTNYISSLFLSWFFINFIILFTKFHNNWHYQMNTKPSYILYNRNCLLSWIFCVCPCYYINLCNIRTNSIDSDWIEYQRDENGNIAGSHISHFGVTWQDYQYYILTSTKSNIITNWINPQNRKHLIKLVEHIGMHKINTIAPSIPLTINNDKINNNNNTTNNNGLNKQLQHALHVPKVSLSMESAPAVLNVAPKIQSTQTPLSPWSPMSPMSAKSPLSSITPGAPVAVPLEGGMEQLPFGWEAKRKENGDIYFINNNNGTTTFEDPRPLPLGWSMNKDKNGDIVFINNFNRKVQIEDPREPIIIYE